MAQRFTRPFMYDFIGRSNRALWGSQKPQRIKDTTQLFQRTLHVGHCLIASGPADLSVGFCTVAIVTPSRPSTVRSTNPNSIGSEWRETKQFWQPEHQHQ